MPPKHPVPALFERFGMPAVKTTDEFSLNYKDGLMQVVVKRSSGKVETNTQTVNNRGGFSQMTNFDPSSMSLDQRNSLIKKLYKGGRGDSQSNIGKIFGLTQAQISRIVK